MYVFPLQKVMVCDCIQRYFYMYMKTLRKSTEIKYRNSISKKLVRKLHGSRQFAEICHFQSLKGGGGRIEISDCYFQQEVKDLSHI